MDKIEKLMLCAAVAGAVASCQNGGEYSGEVQKLDSLQAVVESYETGLDTVELERVEELLAEANARYEYIATHHPDTASKQFWMQEMAQLANIRKNLNRFVENYGNLKDDIQLSTKQLQTLENSLQDEKLGEGEELQKEQAKNYLQDEVEAVKRIEFLYTRVLPETKRSLAVYDSLKPRYDSIADYLRRLE